MDSNPEANKPGESVGELLPCPFCGGAAMETEGMDTNYARCADSHCIAGEILARVPDWNTRPAQPVDRESPQSAIRIIESMSTVIRAPLGFGRALTAKEFQERAIKKLTALVAAALPVESHTQVGLNLLSQLVRGKNALRVLDVFPCNIAEHNVGCECFWEQCEAWAKAAKATTVLRVDSQPLDFCYAEGDEGSQFCGSPKARHCHVLGTTAYWESFAGQKHLAGCMQENHLIHHQFVDRPVSAERLSFNGCYF